MVPVDAHGSDMNDWTPQQLPQENTASGEKADDESYSASGMQTSRSITALSDAMLPSHFESEYGDSNSGSDSDPDDASQSEEDEQQDEDGSSVQSGKIGSAKKRNTAASGSAAMQRKKDSTNNSNNNNNNSNNNSNFKRKAQHVVSRAASNNSKRNHFSGDWYQNKNKIK
jgi:hypothetical protein